MQVTTHAGKQTRMLPRKWTSINSLLIVPNSCSLFKCFKNSFGIRNQRNDYFKARYHHIPLRKRVKPMYSSQLVPGGASSLLQVRHRTSSSSSNRQSRVRQAAVNSVSSHRTDEAVSMPSVLYSEYYDSFSTVTDFYSAQDNTVNLNCLPIYKYGYRCCVFSLLGTKSQYIQTERPSCLRRGWVVQKSKDGWGRMRPSPCPVSSTPSTMTPSLLWLTSTVPRITQSVNPSIIYNLPGGKFSSLPLKFRPHSIICLAASSLV